VRDIEKVLIMRPIFFGGFRVLRYWGSCVAGFLYCKMAVNVLNILYEAEKGVSMHVDNIGDFTPPANPTIEDPLNTYGKCDYFMDSGYDEDGIPVT